MKKIVVFIFLTLIFHYSLIIPKMQWNCVCQIFPKKINCCCNCPYCVAKRGGFKCYCHIHHNQNSLKYINCLVIKDSCNCKGYTVFDNKDNFLLTEKIGFNIYILEVDLDTPYHLLLRPPFPAQLLKPPWNIKG